MRSRAQRLRARRGFTLIELLISVAVGMIVIAGVSGAFISQARQYQAQAGRRDILSGSRGALSFLEKRLRMAGYGVDPELVITAWDGLKINDRGTGLVTQDVNYPDAITLLSRDPLFVRRTTVGGITSGSPRRVTLSTPLTEALLPGQILLLMCGARDYAFVTVDELDGMSIIQLKEPFAGNVSPMTQSDSRFQQNGRLSEDCFSTVAVTVTKIDRWSFYVDEFDGTPYLMLHRGLDANGDGAINSDDGSPLATGVEQLQLAYVINSAPDQVPTVVGASGTGPFGLGWNPTDATQIPTFLTPYFDGKRYTSQPSNVRQVRLTMAVRSATPVDGFAGERLAPPTGAPSSETLSSGTVAWRQFENLGNTPISAFDPTFNRTNSGFLRHLGRISVTPKNLLMRSQFLPPNRDASNNYTGG